MLKPRQELEIFLTKYFSNLDNKKIKQEYYLQLESEYNIPIGMSSDIITLRKNLSEYNEFILFAITSIVKPDQIKKWFTDREIKNYSKQKLKTSKIKFPIKLKMFEVTPDQWIGVSSAQFLMKLRDAQYINYNAETQRALEIMVNNGKEIYVPSVDYKSVSEIDEAYEDKSFIPNTLSLNISQDDELADFDFYDNILTIHNITAFDIFDGFHRYLAMGRNYDRDKDFNYPIELRITNFSVTKAKQFIFQEDHKTKMKKIDEAIYDQRNPSNMVCERLNADSTFNFFHKINLSDGLINYGELSLAINKFYFNNNKVQRKEIIHTANELRDKINNFSEEYEEYLERKWCRHETYLIIYGINAEHSNQDIKDAINSISKDNKSQLQKSQKLYKKDISIIKEVYGDE